VARTIFVAGALVVKKWLNALESRMAHCFMVAASTLIVLRRIKAARHSCGWGSGSKLY
jgi:hypothetical protein